MANTFQKYSAVNFDERSRFDEGFRESTSGVQNFNEHSVYTRLQWYPILYNNLFHTDGAKNVSEQNT